jgi:exopolysaccharide biosynthesis polyprenyl glycosylphosphotransferase
MFKLPKYKYYFALSDLLILSVSFLFAASITYQNSAFDGNEILVSSLIGIFIMVSLVFIFELNSLYKIHLILSRSAHLTALVKALFIGMLYIVSIFFILKISNVADSSLAIFIFSVSSLLLMYFVRIELLRYIYLKLNGKQFKRNIIIVGDGKGGKLLATKLFFENPIGLNLVGFVDDNKPINEEIVSGKKVLGQTSQILDLVKEHRVDEIIIALDEVDYERLLEVLDMCRDSKINVKLTSKLFDIVPKKLSTEKYASIPVVDLSPIYTNSLALLLKRTFDVVFAVVGLIILSPLFLALSFLIMLTSSGPIFFKQTRIGKNGKPFQFFKFRSMYVSNGEDEERKKMMIDFMKNESNNGADTKVINAGRLTPIGKFIRKTSLDELPQLFNVIKGDMSLVGPRPCLPYEFKEYDSWQKRRVSVLPGCTGVWQVSGRSSVSFTDSIVLDLYYVNNMSPWLDLKLILKTVPVMLLAKGGK